MKYRKALALIKKKRSLAVQDRNAWRKFIYGSEEYDSDPEGEIDARRAVEDRYEHYYAAQRDCGYEISGGYF